MHRLSPDGAAQRRESGIAVGAEHWGRIRWRGDGVRHGSGSHVGGDCRVCDRLPSRKAVPDSAALHPGYGSRRGRDAACSPGGAARRRESGIVVGAEHRVGSGGAAMVWSTVAGRASAGIAGLAIACRRERQSRIPLRCIRATVHVVAVMPRVARMEPRSGGNPGLWLARSTGSDQVARRWCGAQWRGAHPWGLPGLRSLAVAKGSPGFRCAASGLRFTPWR